MSLRRKLLLGLLIIPFILALLLAIWPVSPSDPHNGVELLFLIFGLPIIILNYMEWYTPHILDDMFGKQTSAAPLPENAELPVSSPETAPLSARPAWQLAALLVSVLVFGIALGVGALSMLDKASPPSPTLAPAASTSSEAITTAGSKPAAQTATPVRPKATVIPTLTRTATPSDPVTTLILLTPTPASLTLLTTPGTQAAGICISPTQTQFDAIQSNILAMDPSFDIKKGHLVKSLTADNLWFFAAKIYGPGFADGISDPAIWAFSGPMEAPTEIFAINDLALQYSDFAFGQKANPPVDMQTDGAQAAFDCAIAVGG